MDYRQVGKERMQSAMSEQLRIKTTHDREVHNKQFKLQLQKQDLQKVLFRINELGNQFQRLSAVVDKNQFPHLFLSLLHLQREIREVSLQVLNPPVGIADSYSRELTSMRLVMAKEKTLKEQAKFKQDLISQLFLREVEEINKTKEEWINHNKQIKQKWEQDLKPLREQLMERLLICAFCGTAMTIERLNSQCLMNKQIDRKPAQTVKLKFPFKTSLTPSNNYLGTGSHYFGKPKVMKFYDVLAYSQDWKDSQVMLTLHEQINPFAQYLDLILRKSKSELGKLPERGDSIQVRFLVQGVLSEEEIKYLQNSFEVGSEAVQLKRLKALAKQQG